ncbi:MAG: hypothetical protein UX13_C0031G0012 [Candidatus Woesebacteria bacterium GW2011_GWB1_45_5]|uniref:Lipoprotein n=1 Tax=Candidatus Woesebacteria bacterium GW2011_GWB1_45_5 TaxID=1618581 RepID=A0A0G1PWE1_9BACT|nr:MAG: hypothetical protein UX13_C0031G0012 [Candidatus Woesebacteria bacterium GW2011_GWB1_45_5]
MKTRKWFTILVALVFLALALTACATTNPFKGVALEETGEVCGFWNGLWDGWTGFFAILASIFGGNYSMYEVHNNGNWYDFGFWLGAGALFRVIDTIVESVHRCIKRNSLSRGRPCRRATSRKERIEALFEYWF